MKGAGEEGSPAGEEGDAAAQAAVAIQDPADALIHSCEGRTVHGHT